MGVGGERQREREKAGEWSMAGGLVIDFRWARSYAFVYGGSVIWMCVVVGDAAGGAVNGLRKSFARAGLESR